MARDLTLEVLKSIRKEAKQTNQRLEQTNQRLDQTNQRLEDLSERVEGRIDALREELSERIVHSEICTATAISELAGSVREMTDGLRRSS